MRRTKEERLAQLEADLAQHKRKLRMETVPGVKEAVFLARALRKWQDDYGVAFMMGDACADIAALLERCAEEPQ